MWNYMTLMAGIYCLVFSVMPEKDTRSCLIALLGSIDITFFLWMQKK